jgi:DNA-binding CsgD family transcriptional regulator
MPHARATPHRNSEIDEQRLLTLLLSGLTDTAIARQLGAAHRTVQRHVASLMRDLGAHSRFQIGIRAAIRDRSPNVSRSQPHARTDAYGTDARAAGRPRAAVGDVT